jgi:Arc/MetJ-type ribon-helix-helix transcriptional regulator
MVTSGHFESANEVIEAAVARLMLDPPPDEDEQTLAAIARAENEFERGEDRSFNEFVAEFRARHFSK